MEYTREELIDICEQSFVPESKWDNRDTAKAQIGIGTSYALLKAGCEFEVKYKPDGKNDPCVTNEHTIWIQFYVKNFMWFEHAEEEHRGFKRKDDGDLYHYYLPTKKRLQLANGGDWY